MTFSETFLGLQGVVLAAVGVGLHFSPQTIMPYLHNDTSRFTKETYSVLKGWGSAMIALAAMALQIRSISSAAARRCAFRTLVIVWGMLAFGQWKMILKQSAPWNETAAVCLFAVEVIMALLNVYFGVFETDQPIKVHDN